MFLIFLIFINILSIIINILLIFNDKFVCMFIILQSCFLLQNSMFSIKIKKIDLNQKNLI